MTNPWPKHIQKAYEQVLKIRKNAHAPYSNFQVGAAVKFHGEDQVFYGCNVENASFGATICAERNAIWSGIAARGKQDIEWVIVVADTERPTIPCALCLQVMSEFQTGDFPIYLGNLTGILKEANFKTFLPVQFDTLN